MEKLGVFLFSLFVSLILIGLAVFLCKQLLDWSASEGARRACQVGGYEYGQWVVRSCYEK